MTRHVFAARRFRKLDLRVRPPTMAMRASAGRARRRRGGSFATIAQEVTVRALEADSWELARPARKTPRCASSSRLRLVGRYHDGLRLRRRRSATRLTGRLPAASRHEHHHVGLARRLRLSADPGLDPLVRVETTRIYERELTHAPATVAYGDRASCQVVLDDRDATPTSVEEGRMPTSAAARRQDRGSRA